VRLITVLGLLHLALSAARNAELAGLVMPLLLAAPLAARYAELRAEPVAADRRNAIAAALIVLALVPVAVAFAALHRYEPSPVTTPAAAVAALKADGVSRVFNDYHFGGYLIYAGLSPYIDGRTDLYGANFTLRQHAAVTLADLPGLAAILADPAIEATLLTPRTPAVAWLDRDPGWRRLYADATAVVHVRTGR
jgi:hypothetical protein